MCIRDRFWNLSGVRDEPKAPDVRSLAPAAVMLAFSLVLAVFGEQLDVFSRDTAAQIYDREAAIDRVMTDAQPQPKTRGPEGAPASSEAHHE